MAPSLDSKQLTFHFRNDYSFAKIKVKIAKEITKHADTINKYSFWKIIMSISINRQATQKNIVVEQNQAKKQQEISKQGVDSTSKNQDSVKLTSQVQNLNNMQATSEPQVNTQKVETLKAAILNGEYKVNTERLAEKLSKFEGDFGKAFA